MLLRNSIAEKLLSLTLILSLGWILFGVPYKFVFDQKLIRKEIKQRIKQGVSESEMFVFNLKSLHSDANVEWVNSHEFKKGNQLFDVVRTEGDLLYCINDTQEEKLFSKLDELTQKAGDFKSNGKKTFHLKLFFAGDFFEHAASFAILSGSLQNSHSALLEGEAYRPEWPPEVF